jgi:hypothetical protein
LAFWVFVGAVVSHRRLRELLLAKGRIFIARGAAVLQLACRVFDAGDCCFGSNGKSASRPTSHETCLAGITPDLNSAGVDYR